LLRNSACETVFSLIVPNYVCSITNDIFSYDKEVKDGKEMDNYIYYITTPSTSIEEIKSKLLDEISKIWMQQA